jgi:hypothetical protein
VAFAATAVACLAQPASPTAAHQNLTFEDIRTVSVMYDNTGSTATDPRAKVSVTCTAKPNPAHRNRHDRTLYTVSITRANAAGTATYSLLTLGVQAASHKVRVRSLSPGAVLLDPNNANHVPGPGKPVDIEKTGLIPATPGNPDHNPVEDNIWLVRFTGATCELEVEAVDRKEVGNIRWTTGAYASGHDNTPPPSSPN